MKIWIGTALEVYLGRMTIHNRVREWKNPRQLNWISHRKTIRTGYYFSHARSSFSNYRNPAGLPSASAYTLFATSTTTLSSCSHVTTGYPFVCCFSGVWSVPFSIYFRTPYGKMFIEFILLFAWIISDWLFSILLSSKSPAFQEFLPFPCNSPSTLCSCFGYGDPSWVSKASRKVRKEIKWLYAFQEEFRK